MKINSTNFILLVVIYYVTYYFHKGYLINIKGGNYSSSVSHISDSYINSAMIDGHDSTSVIVENN